MGREMEQIEVTFHELCMADEGFLEHVQTHCEPRESDGVWVVPVVVIEQYPTQLETKEPLLPSEQDVLSAKMVGAMELYRRAATFDSEERAEGYRQSAREIIEFVKIARARLEAA